MRLPFGKLIISLGFVLGVGVLPVHAQISNDQVAAFVEALRQASPQTGSENDGLYNDWQIKPDNIPRWSRSCIGRAMTPTEFESSPETARTVVTCVMRDVLQDEYRASSNNETLAVRRAAAWWMRGDPSEYDSPEIASYIQRVLTAYQQQRGPTTATTSPIPSTPAQPPQPPQLPDYDRYMQAGYTATQAREYDTALIYFKRALDERPNDTYAQQAIRNVEGYRDRPSENSSGDRPTQQNTQ